MSNAIVLNEENFETETKSGLTLVDFWAPWCGPCQMMLPILDEFAGEMGDKVTVGKVNVDENPAIAGNFRVMSIPTLILFKDGKAVEQVVGVQQLEALKSLAEKHA